MFSIVYLHLQNQYYKDVWLFKLLCIRCCLHFLSLFLIFQVHVPGQLLLAPLLVVSPACNQPYGGELSVRCLAQQFRYELLDLIYQILLHANVASFLTYNHFFIIEIRDTYFPFPNYLWLSNHHHIFCRVRLGTPSLWLYRISFSS